MREKMQMEFVLHFSLCMDLKRAKFHASLSTKWWEGGFQVGQPHSNRLSLFKFIFIIIILKNKI